MKAVGSHKQINSSWTGGKKWKQSYSSHLYLFSEKDGWREMGALGTGGWVEGRWELLGCVDG